MWIASYIFYCHEFFPRFDQGSAKVVAMCAFGAHSFKEIARTQLASAAKFFLKREDLDRKLVSKADKYHLVK